MGGKEIEGIYVGRKERAKHEDEYLAKNCQQLRQEVRTKEGGREGREKEESGVGRITKRKEERNK